MLYLEKKTLTTSPQKKLVDTPGRKTVKNCYLRSNIIFDLVNSFPPVEKDSSKTEISYTVPEST